MIDTAIYDNESVVVTFKMLFKEKKRLLSYCKKHGLTMSGLIRILIEKELKKK